ncbi:SNF2 family N-terminal domain-containing protein [Paraphysoderma sedebokerense]|nr:SNF2 family N-terminal domain-containing protein [Paraphysoderma sedebokerense]
MSDPDIQHAEFYPHVLFDYISSHAQRDPKRKGRLQRESDFGPSDLPTSYSFVAKTIRHRIQCSPEPTIPPLNYQTLSLAPEDVYFSQLGINFQLPDLPDDLITVIRDFENYVDLDLYLLLRNDIKSVAILVAGDARLELLASIFPITKDLEATATAISSSIKILPDEPAFLPFFSLFYPVPSVDQVITGPSLNSLFKNIAPSDKISVSTRVQPPALLPHLLPFQQRSVAWCLFRERVKFDEEGCLIPIPDDKVDSTVCSVEYDVVNTGKGVLYLNRIRGICADHPIVDTKGLLHHDVHGGILAEEMGLGKTVEILALILLHKAPSDFFKNAPSGLTAVSTTLIISPSTILSQWKNEIENHCPTLKVGVYSGPKDMKINDVCKYDVILTTYEVLRKEIHYVRADNQRSRRFERKYERKLSVLSQMLWWRVVVDEAQMVESTTSHAAEVAGLIPRRNAWAVTGTPFGKSMYDLWGLLVFLHLSPEGLTGDCFARLLSYRPLFVKFLKHIMLRNSKIHVTHELQLPPQVDEIIPLHFDPVELEWYNNEYQRFKSDIKDGLDLIKGVRNELWVGEKSHIVSTMKSWLLRLRQMCVHPNVGLREGQQRRELFTMDQLLHSMQREITSSAYACERQLYSAKVRRALLAELLRDFDFAKSTYETVLPNVQSRVCAIKEELKEHQEKNVAEQLNNNSELDETDEEENRNRGEDDDTIKSLHSRLLAWQELEHQLLFFLGSIHHEQRDENLEREYYDQAEKLRREMLAVSISKVRKEIEIIQRKSLSDDGAWACKGHHLLINHADSLGGILSTIVFDQVADLIDLLNEQTELLLKWRHTILSNLVRDIVTEEADDKEYEKGLDTQHLASIYMDCYARLLNDRRRSITGQTENIRPHEHDLDGTVFEAASNVELLRSLESDRFRYSATPVNLRYIITELRSVSTKFHVSKMEVEIAKSEAVRLNKELTAQLQVSSILDKELVQMRRVFNARVEYYRRLQEISDSVRIPECEDIPREIGKCEREETSLQIMLPSLWGRKRYLDNLYRLQPEERACNICRNKFDDGLLTPCGHLFCESCLRTWLQIKPSCPVCVAAISIRKTSRVTFREDAEQSKLSRFSEVKNIGVFGAKIDSIVRHLKYLDVHEPNVQSIVFSQWDQVLDIVKTACERNKIGCIKFNGGPSVMKFKTDLSIKVILLNASSQSSGLNLINATHIFLLEPILNPGIDKQAIGRVHRIGQQKTTYVHRYIIKNTIEERIKILADNKLKVHADQKEELASDALEVLKSDALFEKKKKGGELVTVEDLIFVFDEGGHETAEEASSSTRSN